MAQVVMALDFSVMEDFDFNNIVTQWFIDNEVQVKDESFSNGKDILNFNHYEKFKVVIFNFDNLEIIFPNYSMHIFTIFKTLL